MNLNHFKTKLVEEKQGLEEDLSKIAKRAAYDPDDWKTEPEKLNIMPADQNELADVFEETFNKEAIEIELENRLNKVKIALQKIEDNKYGICEMDNCKIEEKRLEVNPAATTCIKHAK